MTGWRPPSAPPSPVATGPRGAAALGRGAGGAYLASSPPRTLPLCQAYPFSVLSRARDRPWELETKRQLNPRAKERPHFLFPHLWRWQGLGSSWALPVRGCPEREESGVTFSFLEFNFNRAHLTLPTVIFFSSRGSHPFFLPELFLPALGLGAQECGCRTNPGSKCAPGRSRLSLFHGLGVAVERCGGPINGTMIVPVVRGS